MHLYLQLTRSLAVTLIWLYCNKLVLRYVCHRVSDLGQVSIPQPGIITNSEMQLKNQHVGAVHIIDYINRSTTTTLESTYLSY